MTSGKQAKSDRAARQAKIDAAAPKQLRAKPALVATVVILTLLALGVAVWFGNRSTQPDTRATPGESVGYPQGATGPDGGIAIASANLKEGAPTLDIYEDFQCPYCGLYEQAFGPAIRQMIDAGEIKAVYHMKTFLDANLNNDSSSRAANAAACAADQGKFMQFHTQVYKRMPAQEGQGYTDSQLEQAATASGLTGAALEAWKQCEAGGTHDGYVQRVEESSARTGVTGTPTFRVNGQKLEVSLQTRAEDFRAQVLAASR